MKKFKLLDLFSGIGGFSLGFESTGFFETICFVEKDKFCQKVLRKHWRDVTIEEDIRNINGSNYEADVITGGFPCQPFSVAGKRKGKDDDRYLWDETIRVVSECKPRWFVGENVEGLININNGMVLRQVQTDLEREGFEVQCLVIPAAGVGAWHQRKRIWIIGHSKHNGFITPKIKGGDREINEGSSQRKNETSQFKGASRRENNEIVRMAADAQISRTRQNERGIWKGFKGTDGGQGTNQNVSNSNSRLSLGENKEIQTRGASINDGSENVSNSDNTRNRAFKNNFRKREETNQGWEKLSQFKFSGHSKNVSNSKSIRYRGRESEECQIGEWSFFQRKQEGRKMGSKIERRGRDVSNSTSIGSYDGEHGDDSEEKQIQIKIRGENSLRNISDSDGEGSQRHKLQQNLEFGGQSTNDDGEIRIKRQLTWWEAQSRICRIPDGVSTALDKDRTNRIKALGNSIVPQIARQIALAIRDVETNDK